MLPSKTVAFVIMAVALTAATYAGDVQVPEQIHLALGSNPSEFAVMWVTQDPDGPGPATKESVVVYGTSKDDMSLRTTGKQRVFQDDGDEKRRFTTHTVRLTGLKPDTTYYYRCGDQNVGLSDVSTFKTLSSDTQKPMRYAVYGDMGYENGVSIPLLKDDVDNDRVDIVTHIGDFAYDMHNDNGKLGDKFMREMSSFTNRVPYMVSPGNHEAHGNFSHYTYRFDGMPFPQSNAPSNWYYSYDVGLVHWVSVSTEVYFDAKDFIKQQYEWLVEDLKKATVNRDKVPWIIMVGHRMMYCSCDPGRVEESATIREGEYGLEDIAQKFGVDLYIAGHNHNYERSYPVYKGKTEKQDLNLYHNPSSLVHIVAGAAGGPELHRPFAKVIGQFSAYHSLKYGYGRLTVHNSTHLYWETVADNMFGHASVEDHVWIVQESHGPHTGAKALYDISQGPSLFRTHGMSAAAEITPGRCPNAKVCGKDGRCFCSTHLSDDECVVLPCENMKNLRGRFDARSAAIWL